MVVGGLLSSSGSSLTDSKNPGQTNASPTLSIHQKFLPPTHNQAHLPISPINAIIPHHSPRPLIGQLPAVHIVDALMAAEFHSDLCSIQISIMSGLTWWCPEILLLSPHSPHFHPSIKVPFPLSFTAFQTLSNNPPPTAVVLRKMTAVTTHPDTAIIEPELDDDSLFEDGDTLATETTSITESVLDYVYENGRRYHSQRWNCKDKVGGLSILPNDDTEQERLDLIHHFYLLVLKGELYCAPIRVGEVRNALDLGTGTGTYCSSYWEVGCVG